MVNITTHHKAEFETFGFSFVSDNTVRGRVPQQGDIDGVSIDVEISLKDFPIKQPTIRLLGINNKTDLYKDMPRLWRHIDEIMVSNDPKESQFNICCLHNWSSKPEYNFQFIYERILDWLNCNVKNEWKSEDDLQSWRILPQYSSCIIFLSQTFIAEFEKIKLQHFFECSIEHSIYNLNTGASASMKKMGNDYKYSDIQFPNLGEDSVYSFFPSNSQDKYENEIKKYCLSDGHMKSKFNVIRLPKRFTFKTTYQLMQCLILNTPIKKLSEQYRNLPVMVLYQGDKGKTEIICFITSKEYIEDSEISSLQIINYEVIPATPIGIDLKVGVLGVGALGSQVCKMLAHKKTTCLVLSDYDRLAVTNLGSHELGPFFLGDNKAMAMSSYLAHYMQRAIPQLVDSEEMYNFCDILVVVVGDKQSFDRLAFKELVGFSKPIIWAWTSSNNILQEIVVTTPSTGCLNCYYNLIETDKKLYEFHLQAEEEKNRFPTYHVDYCGNPHTVSLWERMSFLAGQIVTIISYYSKHNKFKYDYYNYYWGMDDIMPNHVFGFLDQHQKCTCKEKIFE